MKKVLSVLISAMLIASLLSVALSANCFNPNGGCEIETKIYKADPSAVVKDGVISEGEYREIEINRDPNTTDCLFTYESAVLEPNCEEMLQKSHFYLSWDEVHGLNIAAVAYIIEEPENLCTCPDSTYYGGDYDWPGDEFLFQFGMMFRVTSGDNNDGAHGIGEIINRGISVNTETGEQLIGHYGTHGYVSSYLDLKPGEDFFVKVDGHYVTYEMSYPIDAVVKAQFLSGTSPAEGTMIYFCQSITGGSVGMYHKTDTNCYAVSVGDGGYMTKRNTIDNLSDAIGYFTNETVVSNGQGGGNNETGDNGGGNNERVTAVETYLTTNDKGEEVVETRIVDKTVENNSNSNTNAGKRTGDPMIIIASVCAISACGVVIFKKKH